MLTRIKAPYIAERFLGVTIPENGTMYACSYEGLHELVFEDPIRVHTDESGGENYEQLRSKGEALGLFGGTPILADSQTKISYTFSPRSDTQRIQIERAGRFEVLKFVTLSGDWFFATLSKCGRFLLLAEPYAIEVFKVD